MTEEELFFENETRKHQQEVAKYMLLFADMLMKRAIVHDRSKLREPERSVFIKVTPKLKSLTYGSDEYKDQLKKMGVALEHHYRFNPHHPEFFELNDTAFHLANVVEMVCDWLAAIKRHEDGSIENTMKVNTERFKLDPQFARIIHNTLLMLSEQGKIW